MLIHGGLTFNIYSFKKEAKMKRRTIPRKKIYERLKPWSLLFGLNGFTHNLIGPQTNRILLIM
jgi:hypothetical protein